METRKGCHSPCNWSYRSLWAVTWVLGMETRSCERIASALLLHLFSSFRRAHLIMAVRRGGLTLFTPPTPIVPNLHELSIILMQDVVIVLSCILLILSGVGTNKLFSQSHGQEQIGDCTHGWGWFWLAVASVIVSPAITPGCWEDILCNNTCWLHNFKSVDLVQCKG